MLREELFHDPYSVFKRLRRDTPVFRLEEPNGPWLIARHADVVAILKDSVRFRSSRVVEEPFTSAQEFILKSRGIVGADLPEHPRLRGKIRDAFAPPRMRILEEQIRGLARERMREFARLGAFELVGDFSKLFPMQVLTMLMGIEVENAKAFARWCDILVTWGSPGCALSEAEVMRNATQMHEFFSHQMAERSGASGEDLISYLARKLDKQEKNVAPRELLALLRLLLVAGTETTTHLIGNTVLALLDQPGLWEAVAKNRELIPELIEESLRFDGPVPSLVRWACADTVIGGITIRKDETVLPLLASANHDETVFPMPETFDLGRPYRAHLSFGCGPHFCLGTTLARLQIRIVFEEFFDAFSKIESLETSPVEKMESFFVRGPLKLSLQVTARASVSPI